MSELSYPVPLLNQPDKTEDPKIATALTAIETWANGNIDTTNIRNEGVEGASLKAASITDAKIAANRQLVNTSNPYVARAALFSAETLTGGGASTWTNPSATREIIANLDFELHAENLRGCIVNLYVGGILINNFFLQENAKDVRMGTAVMVAPSEVVTFELVGGGGVKLSGIRVGYRIL